MVAEVGNAAAANEAMDKPPVVGHEVQAHLPGHGEDSGSSSAHAPSTHSSSLHEMTAASLDSTTSSVVVDDNGVQMGMVGVFIEFSLSFTHLSLVRLLLGDLSHL